MAHSVNSSSTVGELDGSTNESLLSPSKRKAARSRWSRSVRKAVTAQRFVDDLEKRGQTYLYADPNGKVAHLITVLFALPQFSLIPLTLLINLQIILYYNEVGVTLGFLAFFQIFARSFDVLTDPLMAHISDNKTHTRCGRRMPYVWLAPIYGVAFFILVSPPTTNPRLATAWFGFSYIIFYLTDTIVNVPFQALGPELSDDSEARSSLYMWVKIAEGIGVIVGSVVPSVLLRVLAKEVVYQLIAGIFGGWYVISMYALASIVKERPASLVIQQEQEQEFVPTILRALRNEAFRPLLFGWIFDYAGLAMIASMLPFWIIYFVKIQNNPESFMSVALGVLFVCNFCSIPLWRYVSLPIVEEPKFWYERIRIGKYYAWLSYNLLLVITNFSFFSISPGASELHVLVVTGVNGIPFGGQFLISSILADVIDYDELLNFTRNEGSFTVFSTFIPKLVAIPAQSLPLVIMFFLGYREPKMGQFLEQPQAVKTFIQMAFVTIPALFTCCSFIIKKMYYPIKTAKIMDEISKGISVHMEGKPAVDPITNKIVTIEQYTPEEQVIVSKLDHFGHKQLLYLLNPEIIVERVREERSFSNGSEATMYSELDEGAWNCCGSHGTEKDFEIVKRSDGTIDHVSAHGFSAYGAERGITMMVNRMRMWIVLGTCTSLGSLATTIITFDFLNDPTLAMIPAFASLFVGLGAVFASFNVLRLNAALYLLEEAQRRRDKESRAGLEELFARVIYPKTKGQRGGEDIDKQDMEDIALLVPRPTKTTLRELDHEAVREFREKLGDVYEGYVYEE